MMTTGKQTARFNYYRNRKLLATGTIKELSEITGLHEKTIGEYACPRKYELFKKGLNLSVCIRLDENGKEIPPIKIRSVKDKIYAWYYRDKFVCEGSLEELAKKLHKSYFTMKWHTTPTAMDRQGNRKNGKFTGLVCVDDDEEDEDF